MTCSDCIGMGKPCQVCTARYLPFCTLSSRPGNECQHCLAEAEEDEMEEKETTIPKAGDRVVFLEENGESWEPSAASVMGLVKGQTYTVEKVFIGNWGSLLFLKEFPGHNFNSVMFRVTDAPPSETSRLHEWEKEYMEREGTIPTRDEVWEAAYREGLERAAKQVTSAMGDWEQGILESVNSGDATMADIRLELKRHKQLLRYLMVAVSGESVPAPKCIGLDKAHDLTNCPACDMKRGTR